MYMQVESWCNHDKNVRFYLLNGYFSNRMISPQLRYLNYLKLSSLQLISFSDFMIDIYRILDIWSFHVNRPKYHWLTLLSFDWIVIRHTYWYMKTIRVISKMFRNSEVLFQKREKMNKSLSFTFHFSWYKKP